MLKMKHYLRNWKLERRIWNQGFNRFRSQTTRSNNLQLCCRFSLWQVWPEKRCFILEEQIAENASTCLPVFCWCSCGHHCLGSTGWNWKRLGTDTKVTIRTDCAHGLSGWVAHCCAESMTALLRQKKETNIKTSLRNAPPKFDSSTLRSKHLQRIIFQPSF